LCLYCRDEDNGTGLRGVQMKLVTYRRDDAVSCGVLTDGGIVDIPSYWAGPNPPRSIIEILRRGQEALEKTAGLVESAPAFVPVEQMALLAPIPRPGKVLALAGNYSEHIKEAALKRGFKLGLSDSPRNTTVPRPFLMPATAVTGAEIPWPCYSRQLDYEIELGVVIGRSAKCVPVKGALEYVAGYMIVNDVSARSVTFSAGRQQRPWDEFYDWLNGKWADGFCPTGPYLLTADEVDEVQNLRLTLKVNGRVRQNANTSQMIYGVADIVSFLSHLMTLEPGDVIATGTPSGVAIATGEFLEPGDVIEATIDKLGTLSNTVGKRPEQFYEPLKEIG